MGGTSRRALWRSVPMGGHTLDLLNLDHPEVAQPILAEMGRGFAVYYDNRWDVTERLCRLLLENPGLVAGKRVLVLGAGVGAEVVAAGLHTRELYLNDRSDLALDLSLRQLVRNGVSADSVFLLPGDFSTIPLPDVDLALACYVVYDSETRQAMTRFLDRCPAPLLLVNGDLPPVRALLRDTPRDHRPVPGLEDLPCAWLEPRVGPPQT